MSYANIRRTFAAAASLVFAAVVSLGHAAAPKDLNVVVLPSAFRIEDVYFSEVTEVLRFIESAKPRAVVVKVCAITPEQVVARFQGRLYEIHSGGQSIVRMPKNALECSFGSDAERSRKKT